jgi:hypothetical protein
MDSLLLRHGHAGSIYSCQPKNMKQQQQQQQQQQELLLLLGENLGYNITTISLAVKVVMLQQLV